MSKKLELKDKIEMDARRSTPAERRTIHLFKEGSFFRLFNYSVWLHTVMVFNEAYREQVGAKQPLAISKNTSKDKGEFIMGGFPIRSAEKYSGGYELNIVDDTYAEIVIPDEVYLGFPDEEYEQKYSEFFDAIELKQHKQTDPQTGTVHQDGTVVRKGLIDIMRDVMRFQLVEHTPTEAVEFLRCIQRDINRLM